MLVVCASVATLSTMTLKSSIEWEIQNSLQIVAASVNETYTNRMRGIIRKMLEEASGKVILKFQETISFLMRYRRKQDLMYL